MKKAETERIGKANDSDGFRASFIPISIIDKHKPISCSLLTFLLLSDPGV